MIVRKATEKDFPSIYFMGHDTWGETLTLEQYALKCSESDKYESGQWFVLEIDNKIVSSLICYRNSFGLDENTVGIGSVATLPEYRNRGYVTYLMKEITQKQNHGKDVKAFFLFSDIKPSFYEQFGFKLLPLNLQRYEKSKAMVLDLKNHFHFQKKNIESIPVYF
ncbi:GNAT family N-acetyltransferase [Fluviispira multicolorata]|nr:GNAT family N-acetyltransferase [Fluviispira multicolorata]